MPGTASTMPMLTTGLLGGSTTTSALPMASRTPGPAVASSAPTGTIEWAVGAACSRTQYSWKCTARRPPGASGSSMTTWVSTRSSLIGRRVTPGSQRRHSAAVTSD